MLTAIKGLHEGARGQVRVDGCTSEWFPLSVGLRQGAIFSPTLFNIFLGEIIRQMRVKFHAEGFEGAKIVFKRTGVVTRGVQWCAGEAHTDIEYIFEALFADDLVLFASRAGELQRMIDILNKIVKDFGQEISVQKTKIMVLQMKNQSINDGDQQPEFMCNGSRLEIVKQFRYLGGLDTDDAKMDAEIAVRGQRMRGAYAKYARTIFHSNLRLRLKVNLFKSIVTMNGLFGCQVWNVKKAHIDELEAINFSLIRRMFGKNKLEWGRTKVMEWAHAQNLKIYPLEWVMIKLQLRYAGHELRVPEEQVHRLPHNMLFRGHLAGHRRLQGGLEQAYPATLTRAVECCGLQLHTWVDMALWKSFWKSKQWRNLWKVGTSVRKVRKSVGIESVNVVREY